MLTYLVHAVDTDVMMSCEHMILVHAPRNLLACTPLARLLISGPKCLK